MAETKKPTNKERLQEITAGIEQGIKELFESDRYMAYLRTMSRFHSYSVNNQMLIHMQMPGATLVAGFNKWKNQFERHVKQGERGIKIIAPTPFKKKVEEMKLDPDTRLPMLDREGRTVMEEKEVEIPMFRPVTVFDLSQTEGKPLPQLASELHGNVRHYEAFMEALRRSSPVPVGFEKMQGMDGYFSPEQQRVAICEGMSEVQTVCAAVHEITHAKLHNYEKARLEAARGDKAKEPPKPKDEATQEVEAESVSYAVCQYYGIETGENSFGYIAAWSSGKELPELRASLETISRTASSLITDIDRHFRDIAKERGIDLTAPEEAAAEPEADTPERFAADLYDYMDSLHRAGMADHPFPSEPREQALSDIVSDLQRGDFQDYHYLLSSVGLPSASDLQDRLDRLWEARDAALVFQMEANPLTTGMGDRHYIQAYERTEDPARLIPREVIYVGSPEECRGLLARLESRAVTVEDVRAYEREKAGLPPRRYGTEKDGQPERLFRGKTPEEFTEQDALLFLADTDMRLFGLVTAGTLETMKKAGYRYENGALQPAPETEAVYRLPASVMADLREKLASDTGEQENLYVLDESVYLHLQECENGYDYTLYDVDTYRALDGGQIAQTDIPISTACLKICGQYDLGAVSVKYAPVLMIETLQEAEQKAAQIEAAAFSHVLGTVKENGLGSTVFITGVRACQRGDANPEKPGLDVLVEYGGPLGEDDFYNLLHSQGYAIDGIAVDFRPINPEFSGTIQEYLERLKKPQEKTAAAEKAPEPERKPAPASILPDAPELALDEYPMPDPALTVEDLETCGYLDGDLLPLSKDRALELYEQELTVYAVLDGGEASMAFDREDIEDHGGMFAVPREEWGASKEFIGRLDDRLNHQQEREHAFLSHKGDCFAIYQLHDGDDLHFVRYEPLERLRAAGGEVLKENYNLIYTAPLTVEGDTETCLHRIYQQFNLEHPEDFRGQSLSISDIVAIKRDGEVSCHYVDSGFGFTMLPDFLKPENYLKNAEMAQEDDYGMIDGIINNGQKQPTVAELEAQVKAGGQISLLDLAGAVHREQGDRKTSVVERLKQQPPQQDRKKTAPKKSAEREL